MEAPQQQPSLFGTRVRQIRERRRLTQQELAALSHTAYNTIWKIESGKLKAPSVYVAARIARALSASLDFLAGLYDEHAALDAQRTAREQQASELLPAAVEMVGRTDDPTPMKRTRTRKPAPVG
jgi:transcriptional regulator with XRE-family HTH domain